MSCYILTVLQRQGAIKSDWSTEGSIKEKKKTYVLSLSKYTCQNSCTPLLLPASSPISSSFCYKNTWSGEYTQTLKWTELLFLRLHTHTHYVQIANKHQTQHTRTQSLVCFTQPHILIIVSFFFASSSSVFFMPHAQRNETSRPKYTNTPRCSSHALNMLSADTSPLRFISPGRPTSALTRVEPWKHSCVCARACCYLSASTVLLLRITNVPLSCQHPSCVFLFTAFLCEHALTQTFV